MTQHAPRRKSRQYAGRPNVPPRLKKIIGENFQRLRIAAGYDTRHQAARDLGLRPDAMWKFEKGHYLPTPHTLWKYAWTLGLEVDSLFPEVRDAKIFR